MLSGREPNTSTYSMSDVPDGIPSGKDGSRDKKILRNSYKLRYLGVLERHRSNVRKQVSWKISLYRREGTRVSREDTETVTRVTYRNIG